MSAWSVAAAEIREAEPADVPALVALEQAVFTTDRLSRRSWRRLVTVPSACVLVAECGGALVGSAVLLFRRNSRQARLYSLARDARPDLGGLGAKLLAAAERCAAMRDCITITLEVQDDNKKALRLYERAGYRAVAQLPAYYETGRDGTRMIKSLDLSTR